MNLAPLLAELAGLKALPAGLLQPAQRGRLETVRAVLVLAQHVLPGSADDLPRVRLSVGDGVAEGTVVGCGAGSLQFRLGKGAGPADATAVLLHFSDGRPPRAIQAAIRPGPTADYWLMEALDGMLDDADQVCEERLERARMQVVALSA